MPQDEINFNIKGQEFLVNLNKGTVKTSDFEWKKWESVFLEIAMADGEKGVSGEISAEDHTGDSDFTGGSEYQYP